MKGDIIILGHNVTQVIFKNCVTLTKCITEIGGAAIAGAADLDLVMPMYDFLQYS